MLLRARHYVTAQLIDVTVANGVIASVGPAASERADFQAEWIAPGLFDLQINGCMAHSFNSATLTLDEIREVVSVCRQHGISGLCPTLVTGSFAAVAHGLATLRQACGQDQVLAAAIGGVHLEGPYIAAEDGPRGAHPRQHVRPPDWDEFLRWQDAAGGLIRLLTLAPELPGAIPFIEKLTAAGVVAALGHTAANRECIHAAIAAGARLSTHLGNGSHALLPRHDNYLWEQLAADELMASIICDGHHLPATLVKCFVRVKTPDRLILTCDASTLAGLLPGRYQEWGQEFEVLPEGKIVVAGTRFLAGSWSFTDRCLGNVLNIADVNLAETIDMAGKNPRQLLGLPARAVTAGCVADLVLFDWRPGGEFQVRKTLTAGDSGVRGREPGVGIPDP
jgi:N-acetylglucosamine-6-phosphate deacetylase